MKKLFLGLASAIFAFSFTSCEYDDDDLWDKVNGLDSRVEALEKASKEYNTNISTLQDLVKAMQEQITVTSVTKGENGYDIVFSNGEKASIANGKDGISAPTISVKKDSTDNQYYWTLDGEWLTVDNKKVRASASTPQVRINTTSKEWEITSDGTNWTSTGIVAEGKDGDAFFQGVETSNKNYVTFTLKDGTEIKLSRSDVPVFEPTYRGGVLPMQLGATTTFKVKMQNVTDYSISKPDGWKVSRGKDSILSVTAPEAANTYAERKGEIAIHAISATGASSIVKMKVYISVLRTLTFEDADYKAGTYTFGLADNVTKTVSKWSDLIDTVEYNGYMLYKGSEDDGYRWYDKNNTELKHMVSMNFWYGTYDYMGGGHAVSNYVSKDTASLESGKGYFKQLSVFNTSGHNGSANFAVHFGYHDNSHYTLFDNLPVLSFGDGEKRVIDHMWVTNTLYAIDEMVYGYSKLTADENDFVKIVAIADDDMTRTCEFYLAKGVNNIVTEWTKWDLSSLGAVNTIRFNVVGKSSATGFFNLPGYFAYDDIAVCFEE